MTYKKRVACLLLALSMLPVPIPLCAADTNTPVQSNIESYEPANSQQYIAPYDNGPIMDTKVIAPRVNYPQVNSNEGATVSLAQMVSFNDISKSYMRFRYDDIKEEPWAEGVSAAYTLVDWRYWDSAKTADVMDRTNITDGENSINTSQLIADSDMVRAINILGDSAFIPENVQINGIDKKYSCYIHNIDDKTVINKTEAISALYKAMGANHFQPPVVLYDSLDGATNGVSQTCLKDTTAASLPEASDFLYYDVKTTDARHLVYISNNLIEGYLWDALQDGVISYKELRPEERSMVLDKYSKGVYASPITATTAEGIPKDSTSWEPSSHNAQQKSIGYVIGKMGENITQDPVSGKKVNISDLRIRYTQPQAFYNESISFLDFCVIASQVMHLRGEQVLTDAEEKILVSSYSSKLPTLMGSDYYDAVMYLTARGIIDDSYIGNGLYEALTWKDCFVICSRIKDKDSRLTFKNVTVPFNLEMANEGYMEVEPAESNLIPKSIEQIDATVDKDNNIQLNKGADFNKGIDYRNSSIKRILYIRKDDNTTFKDSNGKEVFPHISLSSEQDSGEYGYCEPRYYYDNKNKQYYCINIYNNEPVPDCYSYFKYDKSSKKMVLKSFPKEEVKDFVLYAPDCSKRLVVQNLKQDSENLYVYSEGSRLCAFVPTDVSTIKRQVAKIEYIPTAEETTENVASQGSNQSTANEDIKEQKAGEKAIYKIVLPANAKLAAYGTVTEDKFEKITDVSTIPKDKWKDNKVYEYVTGESITLWVVATKTDQVEAAVQANIRYSEASNKNAVAYIRRSDQKDVYYGSNFLSTQLGIRVFENNDDKEFRITAPDQEFKVKYDKTSGWIVYGSNQILCFSTSVPPIKKNTNEGSSEAFFIHGLVIDFYIRQDKTKHAWSTYLGAGGTLNLGAESNTGTGWNLSNIPTKITGAWLDAPTAGGDSVNTNGQYMYRRDMGSGKDPEYYIDVQSIPPQFSNFVLIWDVASDTTINVFLVNIVPQGVATNYTIQDPSELNKYIKRAKASMKADSGYSYSYFQAQAFTDIASLTDLTKVGDKYCKTPKFIYDTNTFTALWRQEDDLVNISSNGQSDKGLGEVCLLSSTDDKVKAFGLPYVYNSLSASIYFVNLPFLTEEGDSANKLVYMFPTEVGANGKIPGTDGNANWITHADPNLYNFIHHPTGDKNSVLSDGGGEDDYSKGRETKGFPIFPLIRIFSDNSITVFKDVSSTMIGSHGWQTVYACPSAFYIPIKAEGTSNTDSYKAVAGNHFPNWAIEYWSSDPKGGIATNASDVIFTNDMKSKGLVAVQVGNDVYIIQDISLSISNDTSKDDLPDTVTKLTAEIVDSLNSIIDMMYMTEKELDAKFKDANSILGLIHLVIVVLLPRILFGLLFVTQVLALAANNRIMILLCEKIFDIFRFLSFGRLTYDRVDAVKLWTTGMFGSVIIILISRGYGLRTLTWFVSAIIDTLQSIW